MPVLRFVETRYFTAQVQATRSEEGLREAENLLMHDPTAGDVIPGAGGLRKVRFKLAGRGKRDGARAIYLYLPELPCIVFVYLYAKARQTDLTSDEKAALRSVAAEVKAHQHLIP